MTTTSPAVRRGPHLGTRRPAPGRVFGLFLRTRHVPAAAGLLALCAAFLWTDLHQGWTVAGGPAATRLAPLVTIAGAAAIVGVATYGPFGEPERATGRWLPYLRLGSSLLLGALAVGLILVAANAGPVAGGESGLARDAIGSIGLGLIAAAVLGGPFAWVAPIAYWLVTESALEQGLSAFYVWPTRPAHDTAAWACALAVGVAGLLAVTVRPADPRQRMT